jgi:ribosomal protein S18 acetylase RimI-like enzyme
VGDEAPQGRTLSAVEIRPARADDREFVLAAVERLADFTLPSWRRPNDIVDVERRTLAEVFARGEEGATIVLAVDAEQRLGFLYMETRTDYFDGRRHGHVSMIVTVKDAEGRGVGTALMTAAEAWTRHRGFTVLTLNVYDVNARARALYERLGFAAETIHYRKEV